ncbi:MAG: CPBP family intramembrane glutamic endopeptidase, partial [Myxococcota bacterium]
SLVALGGPFSCFRMSSNMTRLPVVVLLALAFAGCAVPVQRARTSVVQMPYERELDAQERYEDRACSERLGFLFPGVGHFCLRKPEVGTALATLGAAELGLAVAGFSQFSSNDPRALLPAVAFQNTYIVGIVDPILERQRAAKLLYTPQDSLDELLYAPFNPEVLRRPDVWIGILVTAATQGLFLALDNSDRSRKVNVFGREFEPETGYPLSAAALGATFGHVAIGEEVLFRGYIQSNLTRRFGTFGGWAGGTLIFGAAHIPNAFLLETRQERNDYLRFALPVITGVGGYFGASYLWNDYSLAPPVALHFWYNFMLGLASMIADPDDGFLSAEIRVPW